MSFQLLPDEILELVLYHTCPHDIIDSVQLVSKRFYVAAKSPVLWRCHTLATFKYWEPHHHLSQKLQVSAPEAKWRDLFMKRRHTNKLVSRNLDIMTTDLIKQEGSFEDIGKCGYDAKDFLLEQINCDDSCLDVLSRRYYAQEILGSIHRDVAISQWLSMWPSGSRPDPQASAAQPLQVSRPPRALEKVLACFDMFVLHNQIGDIDEISALLDTIAADFLAQNSNFASLTTHDQALLLSAWLHEQNLVGMENPAQDYRNLRNCFLGQALRHEKHESLPIISSAIFCCLAERLDLDAGLCLIPEHVYTVVTAKPGQTLNDEPIDATQRSPARQRMYLDPFKSATETPVADLISILGRYWAPLASLDSVLGPARLENIAERVLSNIMSSRMENAARSWDDQMTPSSLTDLLAGDTQVNQQLILYLSAWGPLMFPARDLDPDEWTNRLRILLRRISIDWPLDCWLVRKHLYPQYDAIFGDLPRWGQASRSLETDLLSTDPHRIVMEMEKRDDAIKDYMDKCANPPKPVKFLLGQPARHLRYDYICIVTGWIDERVMDDKGNSTGSLVYTCILNASRTFTYLVAESLEAITDPSLIPANVMELAGRYYQRFDPETCRFVHSYSSSARS